jgi:type IV fimbrial biogenesis protein FimT
VTSTSPVANKIRRRKNNNIAFSKREDKMLRACLIVLIFYFGFIFQGCAALEYLTAVQKRNRTIQNSVMKKGGFTIIELLVTFVILGIVTTIAIPGFARWLPDSRLKSATRDVVSNFQLAKLTSVRRNSYCAITFNQVIGGTTYDYAVYVDSDKDLEYDAGEDIITKVLWTDYKGVSFDTAQGGGNGLTFTTNDDGLPSIAFAPDALPKNNLGGLGAGSVFLTNPNGKVTKVVVSSAGNIRIE